MPTKDEYAGECTGPICYCDECFPREEQDAD